MTVYLIFAGFALVHLGLLIWSTCRCFSSGSRWRLSYLRVLLVGLMLDNGVLALGNVLNGTQFFDPATRLRFFMHASILPFLTLYSLSIMRQVQVSWSHTRWLFCLCIGLTLFSLGVGIKHEVMELGELKVIQPMGALRMTAVSGRIPVGTILTNAFMILSSGFIYQRGGPAAFLVGSVGIFIINGALTGNAYGFLLGNLAEIFFVACLLVGERSLRCPSSRRDGQSQPGMCARLGPIDHGP